MTRPPKSARPSKRHRRTFDFPAPSMPPSPGRRSSFPVLVLLCVALFGMPPRDVDAQASLDSLRTAVTVFGIAVTVYDLIRGGDG